MTKRPTDHLEPAPKKRSGDRQISREEPPSDSEGEAVSTSALKPSKATVQLQVCALRAACSNCQFLVAQHGKMQSTSLNEPWLQ